MSNSRFSPSLPILAALVVLAAALPGCKSPITNITSQTVPENPSQIYTITTRIKPLQKWKSESNLRVQIIINGQAHDMRQSTFADDIYEYDFQMPPGVTEAAYYVLMQYDVRTDTGTMPVEKYTPISRIKLTNRYVFTIEANRGPTGARIGVVGRGFTPQDVVYLDSTPTRTVYEGLNSVSFQVPAIPTGNYRVTLNSPAGNQDIGTFHVDGVTLTVSPTALTVRRGERASLMFTVPSPAPTGGLLINVTTDVPHSVIMPEVIIPAGQSSITVNVQGGEPGVGSLFVGAAGRGELAVPITVTNR
ncbi:MAG TPA: IPT/TIG domain-containing protein [Opitutaceae bacterium]|nr:IPT/TIG domain-containing protein [Opitutaceae bacterium]